MINGDKVSDLISEFTPEVFKGKKIAVWGDFILDEYIFTSTGRISREAPVLVTEYEDSCFMLGGAGNVVHNLRSLGADPVPVGFTGDDEAGDRIRDLFGDLSVDTGYLSVISGFTTPRKSRILSGRDNSRKQQVLRIDYLNRNAPDPSEYKNLADKLKKLPDGCDILIVSDYLKESVTPDVFAEIKGSLPDLITIVDSRENLLKFTGASYVTPNEPEIRNLFPSIKFRNDEDFLKSGRELMSGLNCRGMVQKRGHKGMIVFEKGEEPVTIPIHGSADIVDVTGAGDTVIALLSLSLASGVDLVNSAQIANVGASIVVMKEGAYPLKPEELKMELSGSG